MIDLFHLYLPVTRKWRWRYKIWTNPHPLRSCPFPNFPVVSYFRLLTT